MTTVRFYIMFLLFMISSSILAQDIELIFEQKEWLTDRPDFTEIRDVNEELCSVVIIKSDIPGIKFYTNRGVEQVEFDSAQYTVWIPANARMIKLLVPGFPLYESSIESSGDPMVYLMILEVPGAELLSGYRKEPENLVSISTIPKNARLRLDEDPFGRTPSSFELSEISDSSVILVSKIGYQNWIFECDTIRPNMSYSLQMEQFSSRKQVAFTVSAGIIRGVGDPLLGIQFNRYSEIGFYASAKSTFKNDFETFMLSAGINVSALIANVYIGAGYAKIPESEPMFVAGGGEMVDFTGFYFDLGVHFRIRSHLVLCAGASLSNNPEDYGYSTVLYDLSFGLGWAF